MYLSQKDLFRRFVLFLIVIFAFVSAPGCISGLIVSTAYAAQSEDEAAIAEEEQALPQATQDGSTTTSDTEKDLKTKESENISAMSAASGTGEGGDSGNPAGTTASSIDISQFSGSASAKIPIEVPPGRLGMAPKLTLAYNSYRGNGWIGLGWNIDMGAIQRSTKYGVNYGTSGSNANMFVEIKNGYHSELVSRADWGTTYYGAKIEGSL